MKIMLIMFHEVSYSSLILFQLFIKYEMIDTLQPPNYQHNLSENQSYPKACRNLASWCLVYRT